jgi:hypothetical protein
MDIISPGSADTKSPKTPILPADGYQNMYPFTIAAFGHDEAGRLYVINYGAAVWEQEPPRFTSVEHFENGGIYLIQDDLLQFTVHQKIERNQIILEWQSALGVKYSVQSSRDSHHWSDIRQMVRGNGGVLTVSGLPNNPKVLYRVIVSSSTHGI